VRTKTERPERDLEPYANITLYGGSEFTIGLARKNVLARARNLLPETEGWRLVGVTFRHEPPTSGTLRESAHRDRFECHAHYERGTVPT